MPTCLPLRTIHILCHVSCTHISDYLHSSLYRLPPSLFLAVCVFRYFCIAELVEELEEQLERLRDDYHKICRVPVITSLEEETRIVSTSMKVHYTLYMQHCLVSHL